MAMNHRELLRINVLANESPQQDVATANYKYDERPHWSNLNEGVLRVMAIDEKGLRLSLVTTAENIHRTVSMRAENTRNMLKPVQHGDGRINRQWFACYVVNRKRRDAGEEENWSWWCFRVNDEMDADRLRAVVGDLRKPDRVFRATYYRNVGVVSLFDGIGGAREALEQLGVLVKAFFHCEKDRICLQRTESAGDELFCQAAMKGRGHASDFIFESLAHDVMDITRAKVRQMMTRLKSHGITLLVVVFGSPCTDLSSANTTGRGLLGEKSSLFFKAVEALSWIIECRGTTMHVQWLVENVASMTADMAHIFSLFLGRKRTDYMALTGTTFGPMHRFRAYWSNVRFTFWRRFGFRFSNVTSKTFFLGADKDGNDKHVGAQTLLEVPEEQRGLYINAFCPQWRGTRDRCDTTTFKAILGPDRRKLDPSLPFRTFLTHASCAGQAPSVECNVLGMWMKCQPTAGEIRKLMGFIKSVEDENNYLVIKNEFLKRAVKERDAMKVYKLLRQHGASDLCAAGLAERVELSPEVLRKGLGNSFHIPQVMLMLHNVREYYKQMDVMPNAMLDVMTPFHHPRWTLMNKRTELIRLLGGDERKYDELVRVVQRATSGKNGGGRSSSTSSSGSRVGGNSSSSSSRRKRSSRSTSSSSSRGGDIRSFFHGGGGRTSSSAQHIPGPAHKRARTSGKRSRRHSISPQARMENSTTTVGRGRGLLGLGHGSSSGAKTGSGGQ